MDTQTYVQDKTLWQGHPDKVTSLIYELLAHGNVLYVILYLIVLIPIIKTFAMTISNKIEFAIVIFILLIPVIYFIIRAIINYKNTKNLTYIITDKRITIISNNNKKQATYYFYEVEDIEISNSLLDRLFKSKDILINIYSNNKKIVLRKLKEYDQIYTLLNQTKLSKTSLNTSGGIN